MEANTARGRGAERWGRGRVAFRRGSVGYLIGRRKNTYIYIVDNCMRQQGRIEHSGRTRENLSQEGTYIPCTGRKRGS